MRAKETRRAPFAEGCFYGGWRLTVTSVRSCPNVTNPSLLAWTHHLGRRADDVDARVRYRHERWGHKDGGLKTKTG